MTNTSVYQVVGEHPDLPGILQAMVLADDVPDAINKAVVAFIDDETAPALITWPRNADREARARYLQRWTVVQVSRINELGVSRLEVPDES